MTTSATPIPPATPIPEAIPESPHVDPVPPPTGFAAIWKHITDWATIYFWVPMGLICVWLFAKFAYFVTGRKPTENADWIVGMSGSLVKCIFVILFMEIAHQQNGVWLTKAEQLANPKMAMTQAFTQCVTLIVFAYLLSH